MSFKNIFGMRMSAENSFIPDCGSFPKHSDSLSDVLGVGFNLATPYISIYSANSCGDSQLIWDHAIGFSLIELPVVVPSSSSQRALCIPWQNVCFWVVGQNKGQFWMSILSNLRCNGTQSKGGHQQVRNPSPNFNWISCQAGAAIALPIVFKPPAMSDDHYGYVALPKNRRMWLGPLIQCTSLLGWPLTMTMLKWSVQIAAHYKSLPPSLLALELEACALLRLIRLTRNHYGVTAGFSYFLTWRGQLKDWQFLAAAAFHGQLGSQAFICPWLLWHEVASWQFWWLSSCTWANGIAAPQEASPLSKRCGGDDLMTYLALIW